MTNWKEVGCADQRMALVVREGKYSGVGHMFRLFVFGDQEHEFKALSLSVKSSGPLEKKIEKTPAGLGVDGISSARKREIKFLSIDGVEPTKQNIASGKYPMYRPLYLALHKRDASDEARKFVDFVLSAEGQSIISKQGTVNLKEGANLKDKWKAKMKVVSSQ